MIIKITLNWLEESNEKTLGSLALENTAVTFDSILFVIGQDLFDLTVVFFLYKFKKKK